jgi:magnesium chelatase subunit I
MDRSPGQANFPYSWVVGQEAMRRALEISYVSPSVGGVLIRGQRGTAKSTTSRAFAQMMTGELPVTLPIGATDDRVLGGWRVEDLLESRTTWQQGLLEEAGAGLEPGMLYIDEVNLLDDHLVNIILDVASTGVLTVQRDGADRSIPVRFILVGTMNPEEGNLRPQLLDRFGLLAEVRSAATEQERKEILRTVLQFEEEDPKSPSELLSGGIRRDAERKEQLAEARRRLGAGELEPSDGILGLAAAIAAEFRVEGHRGELVMVRAARALAAIEGDPAVLPRHVAWVAELALTHRRSWSESGTMPSWSDDDTAIVSRHVASAEATSEGAAARPSAGTPTGNRRTG